MKERDELLSRIEGLSRQHQAEEQALRRSLAALAERLAAVCRDCSTSYSGEHVDVDYVGPEEKLYGYLTCWEKGLHIAYRSTSDSTNEAMGLEYNAFKCIPIARCGIDWIRELITEGHLTKFIRGFQKHLERLATQTQQHVELVTWLTNSPSVTVSHDFEEMAEAVGYPKAIGDWKEAQAAVATNPERAMSLASKMLETVCKHILSGLRVPLPADESIMPLFRETAKALGLDPSRQAEAELRGFCGGLASMVQNLGALRTKFGEAHGKSASYEPLGIGHARLVVNAAGAAATFLMERHLLRRDKTP